jgi:hypothetical protein
LFDSLALCSPKVLPIYALKDPKTTQESRIQVLNGVEVWKDVVGLWGYRSR